MQKSVVMATRYILLLSTLLVMPVVQAQSKLDDGANGILNGMGDYLKKHDNYSFQAEITYDSFSEELGQELEHGGLAKVSVKRPNQFNVAYQGDNRRSRVVFDGKELIFLDLLTNLFARMSYPGDIDGAIDQLFERYGQSVPVADFLYSDPYRELIENAQYGTVIGVQRIDNDSNYHLAFSGEVLDWQIWVRDGDSPVPTRLVITYKNDPGAPQYRVNLSNWDFNPKSSSREFSFIEPKGASEMSFLPVDGVPAHKEVQQ